MGDEGRFQLKILVLILILLSSNLFIFNSGTVDRVEAFYNTPNNGVEWNMTDLAANATNAVIQNGTSFEIRQNITIMPKDTLVINAGSTLKFFNDTGLTIWGNIIAVGTPASPIMMTTNNTNASAGAWSGLFFDGTLTLDNQKKSVMDHCIIEYAHTALDFLNSSARVVNSTVRLTWWYGISVLTSDVLIVDSEIVNTGKDSGKGGMILEDSNARIDGNFFINQSGSGIFANADESLIINNTFSNVSVGIHIYNSTTLQVRSNEFTSYETGIFIDEGTKLTIEDNLFHHSNGTAVEVGVDFISVKDNHFQNVDMGITTSTGKNIKSLDIQENLFENVSRPLEFKKLADSIIAYNMLNFSSGASLFLNDCTNVNVGYNFFHRSFNDSIRVISGDKVNIFFNIIKRSGGSSIFVQDSTSFYVTGNKMYRSYGNGMMFDNSVPGNFHSNYIQNSALLDLSFTNITEITSVNNTINYDKLYIDSGVNLIVKNYFSIYVRDLNNYPLEDVYIEIQTNNVKSHEFHTGANGMVKNILLTFREYNSLTDYTQNQYVVYADYLDLSFDYIPYAVDISRSFLMTFTTNFPPKLSVQSPKPNSTLSGMVTVNGTAFDPDTPIEKIWIKVGSSQWIPVNPVNDAWTVWYYTFDSRWYNDGYTYLNFSVYDGMTTEFLSIPVIIYNFGIEGDKLSVSIDYPVESEAVWDTIIIRGTTEKGENNVISVNIQIDESEWEEAIPKSTIEPGGRDNDSGRQIFTDWTSWIYVLNTRTLDNGIHTIHVIATDGSEISTDSKTIFVTNIPWGRLVDLRVDFETPGDGETVNGTVNITGIVWGCRDEVSDFKLYIDSQTISGTRNAQGPNWWMFSYLWDTTLEPNGLHEISVWARNTTISVTGEIVVIVENEIMNKSDLNELSISFLYPNEGAILNGTININGVSWSELEVVKDVEIRIDEDDWLKAKEVDLNWVRWSYLWDTTTYQNGLHTLTARINTVNGSSETSEVVVILDNVGLESKLDIVITDPKDNSIINGTVTVRGVSWYGDYDIISVEVQYGPHQWLEAVPLREDWSIWYYDWNTTELENGNYMLQCRVFDGYQTVKSSIEVQVHNVYDTNGLPDDHDPDGSQDDGADSTAKLIEDLRWVINMIFIFVVILIVLIIFTFYIKRSMIDPQVKLLEAKESQSDEEALKDEELEEEE
jgi:hypothetical protein